MTLLEMAEQIEKILTTHNVPMAAQKAVIDLAINYSNGSYFEGLAAGAAKGR